MATKINVPVRMKKKAFDVEFTVVDDETSTPIASVSIVFIEATQSTDINGVATFTKIRRGTYTYTAAHAEYQDGSGTVVVE